jgi:hypothetical protein
LRNFLYLFFLLTSTLHAQEENIRYPLWFLETGRVACQHIAVGYATLSPYLNNSVIAAKKNAVNNYLRLKQYSVKGGQAFWKTERGVVSEGNNIRESFDTTSLSALITSTVVLDSFFTKDIVSVIIEHSDCAFSKKFGNALNIKEETQPPWVTSIPNEKGFIHQIGSSEGFYREISSWERAEKNARLYLARAVGKITIQSRGHSSAKSANEVQNEEMVAIVKNAEIVARWRDVKKNIFYVLARCPSLMKK